MSVLQDRYSKMVSPETKRKVGLWGTNDKQDDRLNIVSDIVNLILEQAVIDTVSDIHLEPIKDGLRIRYRIDGILHIVLTIEEPIASLVVRRLKIVSGMQIDSAATQVSQDGRFKQRVGVNEYDFRLSTFPTVLGEKVVIRVLSNNFSAYDLAKLGIEEHSYAKLKRMLQLKSGLFLVCGPTGSGKTTTLYSFLKEINTSSINIITLEDPVEYQIEGMNQCDIKTKSKFQFADGLKAVLRQDPDIILVGEIRDAETAEIATRASITGHLVFSSIHANSTIGTIVRLVNMGLEPYMISYAMVGVIAQRLVRKICPRCREAYQLTPKQSEIFRSNFMKNHPLTAKAKEEGIQYMGLDDTPKDTSTITLYKGAGCGHCNMTGYTGRLGLYEVLMLNEELREAILQNKSALELQQIAVNSGTVLLTDDAIKRVLAGITSIEEVYPILIERSF